MTLLEKLKAALKKAGLKEGLADHIKIESEDQIEGIVTQLQPTPAGEDELDFKKILSSEEFAKFVETEGFEQVIEKSKILKPKYDSHVSKGIKTFKSKFLKTGSEEEEEEEGGDKTPPSGDKMPAWAKALMEKVDGLQKKDEQTKWADQVSEALRKSKLPEKLQSKWASRVTNGDTKLEEQIKALEEEFEEMGQEFGGAYKGLPTGGGTNTKSASQEEIDQLAKDLF